MLKVLDDICAGKTCRSYPKIKEEALAYSKTHSLLTFIGLENSFRGFQGIKTPKNTSQRWTTKGYI